VGIGLHLDTTFKRYQQNRNSDDCSKLQDLAIVQDFVTAGLAMPKFHSISTADSVVGMDDRSIEAVSKNADRNLP
jgi:hypothetical protein